MLLAHSKIIALSTAILLTLAIASTASAQFTRLAQQPSFDQVDQVIGDQPQPVTDQVVAGNCGCNTAATGSHSGLTLCDIMHGCAFKRDTAHLWDGYCQESKTHCDNGCEPFLKGRMSGGLHGGMLGGCKTCGMAGGTHGCSQCNTGLGGHGKRGLLGCPHGSDCAAGCAGKTTTTTLPVISTRSGCAAGCADAHSNQIQAPPQPEKESAPATDSASQQQHSKPVSIRTRYPHLFPEN